MMLLLAAARSRSAIPFAAAAIIFAFTFCPLRAGEPQTPTAEIFPKNVEENSGARLGVYALDTSNGAQIRYRADERFPVCSTFKVFLASAILQQSFKNPDLLPRRVHCSQDDLVSYSPVCEDHVEDGMTMAELCAAALQDSDNTAANLLMKTVGGPSAVTAFAHANGINLKGVALAERLEASGSFNAMLSHRVRVSTPAEADEELIGWLKRAYAEAA